MTKLNLQYVKDIIKDDYLNWELGDAVMIESQTGTAKTTFVFERILPTLKKGEKLLFVCNRMKLCRDIKIKLMKLNGIEIPDDLNEVDKVTYIAGVRIISYQALGDKLYREKYDLNQYTYIVLDECHYWLTDASFNNQTYLTYSEILRNKFPNANRIYMSATMKEMKKVINNNNEYYKKLHSYYGGNDYSYLDTNYFKKMEDILILIKNDTSTDKWLIFVTNIKHGDSYFSELKTAGIDVAFAHANTKEDYIIDEKFKQKVLILTKAFDNGINIHDDLVKHVVVNSYDETTFLQEIGRVRIDIEAARTINLYIPTMSYNTFHTLINTQYKQQIEQLNLFEHDRDIFYQEFRINHHKVNPILFKLDENNQWQFNAAGIYRLYNDKEFAEEMLNNFKYSVGKYDLFAYIKKQLEWLGLEHTFDESKLIEKVVDEAKLIKLETYLESITSNDNRTIKLYKEEQRILTEMVLSEFGAIINVNKRTKKFNISTLVTIFQDQLKLAYSFESGKEDKLVNGKRKVRRYIIIRKLIN